MEQATASTAWLGTADGNLVTGHGPFTEAVAPPAGGVAFYVQDYELSDPRPWKIPRRIERGRPLPADAAAVDFSWESPDAAPFSVIFQEVMTAIHGGDFEKTVPVVTERGTASGDPAAALRAAVLRQPGPLKPYGWVDGSRGFAGATPELLFSLRGHHLETMALAGTARTEDRGVFAVDEKEIREHEYVARTLVSKLVGLGTIKRRQREILELGSIVHFLTWISLTLETPRTAEEMIRQLHPTPALGPLPRTAESLAQLADWRRRLGCPVHFGAPFGLWDRGNFHAVVAIRGIWWDGCDLALPAGCGVIEASRLVSEWRELRLKREAVKRFLG